MSFQGTRIPGVGRLQVSPISDNPYGDFSPSTNSSTSAGCLYVFTTSLLLTKGRFHPPPHCFCDSNACLCRTGFTIRGKRRPLTTDSLESLKSWYLGQGYQNKTDMRASSLYLMWSAYSGQDAPVKGICSASSIEGTNRFIGVAFAKTFCKVENEISLLFPFFSSSP